DLAVADEMDEVGGHPPSLRAAPSRRGALGAEGEVVTEQARRIDALLEGVEARERRGREGALHAVAARIRLEAEVDAEQVILECVPLLVEPPGVARDAREVEVRRTVGVGG